MTNAGSDRKLITVLVLHGDRRFEREIMSSVKRVLPVLLPLWLALCLSTASSEEPPVPSEGLVLWLDASSIAGADGASVPEWHDQSGRLNHVSQVDGKRRPTLGQATLGGQPAIQFRGKEFLFLAEFKGLAPIDQPFHVVVVFQAPQGGPPSQRLIDLASWAGDAGQGENQRGFWVGFQGSRFIPRLGIANGDEGEARTAIWDAQPHLLELVYRADQRFEIHIDGRSEREATYDGRKFLGFRERVALAIGQHFAHDDHAPTFLHGDIAEVLIYQRPLTKHERFELGTRLTKKYTLKTDFRPLPLFEQDIRPILAANCLSCHSGKKKEAGLDLSTVSAMLAGGEAGPVVVRGHPEFSELIAVLESGKMPPDDAAPLNKKQIELLRSWIEADTPAKEAIVLRSPPPTVTAEDREHWAWQMPTRHDPPNVTQLTRVRGEIDRFVLARLEKEGLSLSPDASPERLVRRVYLDLTGLPPSPQEVDSFLADNNPKRFDQLVDRLLSTHHFGERWGRHWLDVAGYVDVFGSDNDAAIIKELSGKWRYRDFVIRSFNNDKPFDQFLIEQLAGDELSDWKNAESFTPETVDALTATAFLLSANDDSNAPELNTPDVRHHVLQRTAENVANSLFAVTLQCARCHDHKYEALPQVDYYQFQSIFAPIFNVDDWVVSDQRTRPDISDKAKVLIDQHNSQIDGQLKPLQERREQLKEAKSEAEKSEAAQLAQQIAELTSGKKGFGTIPLATENGSTTKTHVLRRGDYLRPGLEVGPSLPAVFLPAHDAPLAKDSEDSSTQVNGSAGRRLTLARSLTDPKSLAGNHVARVFVNRVWQQLFGKGLVSTSDNLGVSGARPSHPKLLDWLTLRFIEDGWRLKPLVRRMVLSSPYRQTATEPESVPPGQSDPRIIDPANQLLWRMNLRRLDSEQLRDAILTVSGQLDRTLGGPPIPLDPRPDGLVVINTGSLPAGTTANRRSVYILARRNYHLTFLRVFDQPIVARNCAGREPSAVVTQSLALLHDDFMLEQSAALAARVEREAAGLASGEIVRSAWRLALGRAPNDDEVQWSVALLERHRKRFAEKSDEKTARHQSLARLCQTLLNTNEFLYVP